MDNINIDEINNIPVKIYTDGCSKGNPGNSGAGIVIKNNDNQII